jgi:hypothetical protein
MHSEPTTYDNFAGQFYSGLAVAREHRSIFSSPLLPLLVKSSRLVTLMYVFLEVQNAAVMTIALWNAIYSIVRPMPPQNHRIREPSSTDSVG